MTHKSVGRLRNLIKKRKELFKLITDYLDADEAIIITYKEGNLNVSGHSSSDAMTLVMLGTATGISFVQAKEHNPDLSLHDFLNQPTSVAINYLQRNGLIE